jgi:anti-anti-sigma factor
VVALHGELDLFSVERAEEAIRRCADRKRLVTIDLRELEFMDSSGIALLVRMNALARRDGFDLLVTRGSHGVQRVLELSGVAGHLTQVDAPAEHVNGA